MCMIIQMTGSFLLISFAILYNDDIIFVENCKQRPWIHIYIRSQSYLHVGLNRERRERPATQKRSDTALWWTGVSPNRTYLNQQRVCCISAPKTGTVNNLTNSKGFLSSYNLRFIIKYNNGVKIRLHRCQEQYVTIKTNKSS